MEQKLLQHLNQSSYLLHKLSNDLICSPFFSFSYWKHLTNNKSYLDQGNLQKGIYIEVA